jgi:hypothetical protein
MDITQLILDDHQEQRRLFGILEQVDHTENEKLMAIWMRLSAFLEVHAEAEEKLFYPELLRLGKGVGGKSTPEAETQDAIHDHNEIRNAISAVATHAVGSKSWYRAISLANKANSDHMGEEEREGLTDFRRHISLQIRHKLAIDFAVFEALHINGVQPVNKDPDTYIAEHT